MADNVTISAVGGNSIVATDQVGTDHYQLIKLVWGPLDTANVVDVASGKMIPIQLRSSTGEALVFGAGAVTNGVPRVTLASDDPVIAAIAVTNSTGLSTHPIVTGASTNPANIKSSAGYLRGITGTNIAGYPVSIRFYNTTGTPTAGSTGVQFQCVVNAGHDINLILPSRGRPFASGIGVTVVKIATAADMSTTSTGATAANDAQFEVLYE